MSKSWTTRPPRTGESQSAYTFVDRKTFEEHRDNGGFIEWAEFLGHLYGSPLPQNPPGTDVVLEIDLQGAAQVKARFPGAVLVLLLPPSAEEQAHRLRARGDDEQEVIRRIERGREEERIGRELTSHVVVNDDVERAVGEIADILEGHRDRLDRR